MDRKSSSTQSQALTFTFSNGRNLINFLPTLILNDSTSEIKDRNLVETSPYKGLKQFEERDWEYFWGRDRLIIQLLERLSENELILLLGASGSGKSSVIKAGLIPRLRGNLGAKFTDVMFQPEKNPFQSLYKALIKQNCPQEIAKILSAQKENSLIKIAQALQAQEKEQYWLIIIDRFEEIFFNGDRKINQKFIESLVNLYEYLQNEEDSSVKIQLILAMQTDFLEKLSRYPRLAEITIAHQNIQLIVDMSLDELRLVIEQPAARNGAIFEEELLENILRDIQGKTSFLPLLQYTLDRLWQHENLSDRLLKQTTYAQIGGFHSSLQARLDRFYNSLSTNEQIATKKIFLALIKLTDDEPSKVVTQKVKLANFTDESEQTLLDNLMENDFIKCDRPSKTVEIIHEFIFDAWTILKEWIEEATQTISLKKQLQEATNYWRLLSIKDSEQAERELWYGWKLETAYELKEKQMFDWMVGGLNEAENEFLDASLTRQNRSFKANEKQIQHLVRSLNEATLKEQAARVQSTIATKPLEGLLLAMVTLGENLDKSPKKVLPIVQTSLNYAMETAREQNLCQGHSDRVNAVAISPDGQIIVSGSWDGMIQLWDLQGNAIVQPFQGHQGDVTSVAFSPDGQVIASGGGDSTVRLWSLAGNSLCRPFWGHQGDVTSVIFSPDGQTLASCGVDGMIRLWDLKGNVIGEPFRGHKSDITSLSFSPDGNAIVSGGGDGTIWLWDLQGNSISEPFQGHEDKVTAVAFSPDGETIASGSWDRTVRLWDLQGKLIGRPWRGHDDYILTIAFSSNGQTIASGSSDKTIRLWDLQGNAIAHPLRGHKSAVRSVAFSPDAKMLISGSTDKTVRMWDLQGNLILQPFQGHEISVWSVACSPTPNEEGEGGIIASGGGDGTVKLWDLQGNLIGQPFRGHQGDVTSVAFSPDGQIIASGSWDRTIRLWDLQGNAIGQPFQGHENDITAIAFSPDGQTIASGSWDRTVRLWDLQGNAVAVIQGHEGDVTSVAFSPNGQIVASGSWDRTIGLWNLQGKSLGKPFRGHQERVNSVAFHPQGQIIASGGGDGTIRLWDLQGNPIGQPFYEHETYVTSVVFSRDGQSIVSGGGDGTVRLWNLQGNPIGQPFEIYKSEVTAVAFSSDGGILVSGSLNGTIYLWRGGGWPNWLQVCCERLRYHPVFKNPQTDLEKQACLACQKHHWNQEAIAWNKQGIAKLEQEAWSTALEAFNRALQISPKHTGALYNRARTYVGLKDAESAIADFSTLIEEIPTHATAYFQRGKCYAQLNRDRLAKEDCQKAAELYQQQGQDANYDHAIAFLHQLQTRSQYSPFNFQGGN
jgi:WD40 repeat protein/energy-coupling factor transporter ATP-binding protein EcfA2